LKRQIFLTFFETIKNSTTTLKSLRCYCFLSKPPFRDIKTSTNWRLLHFAGTIIQRFGNGRQRGNALGHPVDDSMADALTEHLRTTPGLPPQGLSGYANLKLTSKRV
jgi:hypothetical protein